jgi:hypothetical protein
MDDEDIVRNCETPGYHLGVAEFFGIYLAVSDNNKNWVCEITKERYDNGQAELTVR